MAFEWIKYFPGAVKETVQRWQLKVGEFTPGDELAKGFGYALALPGIKKTHEQTLLREKELQDRLLDEYREAVTLGDTNKQERVKKMISGFKYTNVLSEVLQDAPTDRQVLASSGELAILATLGYRPKMFLRKPVTKLGKTALALARVGKEAAIGGGFFGTMKAQEKDATTDDIIKATELGALISGGITVGAMGLSKAFQLAGKYVTPKISAGWQKAMTGLEKAALPKPIVKGPQVKKVLAYVGEKPTQKIAKRALGIVTRLRKARAGLIDRFLPAKRIEHRIAQITGRPLKEAEKIYRDMRLLTSVSDAQAEKLVIQYLDDMVKYANVYDDSVAYMAQLDFIDRAKLGQAVPGNQSLDDLIVGYKKLVKEIGPQKMSNVIRVKEITHKFNDTLLQSRVDSGLITQELANLLRKTHPNYIPHNVIMAVDERVAQGLSQSLNVAKTDIMKAVGSAKNIENPISATIQRTQIATRTMEKNKLLNNFVKAQEKYKLFPGMKKLKIVSLREVTPVKFAGKGILKRGDKYFQPIIQKPEAGYGTVNLFRNGVKETWQVPADIAIAIKNLDAPLTPNWLRFATTPQRMLKAGATKYNLSFTLPNKFRDKQTAYLTSGSFMDDMAKKYGILDNPVDITKFTKAQIDDLYKTSGGYGSSIFVEGESIVLKDLQKRGITKVVSSANPAKIINTINESIETSTRMDVFKRGLLAKLSPKDAALVARDATIDFARMGNWMRPVNQAVPFLNARVQGFVNLPRAFINNPEVFARMQMYTAVYPTMALHQHNRRFESYKNISQYFKNRYWVIMTGETTGIDSYTGQQMLVPQFITIPKGEGQVLVSGPIQHYLDKADGVDFRKTSEMIVDTLGSASPLEFQSFDQGNKWLTLGAQFGPAASIILGLGSNRHPYFGTPIIPPDRIDAEKELQFRRTTPEITKDIANILNVAPANLEFVIGSFGGLSQDIQRGADIAYGVVRNDKIGGHPISQTPFGSLTQIPITRRFAREAREYYSPEMEFRMKQKGEIEKQVVSERLRMKDKALDIYEEMIKLPTKEEKTNYLNALGDELTQEIIDEIYRIKTSRNTVEVLKKTDSVEVRARYIYNRLEEMKEAGVYKEDRKKFLEEMEAAGILTSQTIDKIWQLQNQ